MLSRTLISLVVLCGSSSGFVISPPSSISPPTVLHVTTKSTPTFVANKFWQLEELEDKDDCATEVFLKDDGTVIVGSTDGPLPVEASGEWESDGNKFKMTLTRIYDGGHKSGRFTDIGEFQYEVKRSYLGTFSHVGGEMAVTDGEIHSLHSELGDEKVGYFNILETTDEKPEGSP